MSEARTRIRLADAVDELAPIAPPCFFNRAIWVEFLKSAASAQNMRGEPKVILVVNGDMNFNTALNFCTDCSQSTRTKMRAQDRCNPGFLETSTKKDGHE